VPPVADPATEGFDRIGDFELIEMIGKGAMGRVFKARQVSLGRIVALKVLPADLARNHRTFTLRFLQEARASGRLTHPNVVQGIDCGQDEHSGLWYFAMEYIDGYPLSDELERQRVLPEERVIEIGMAIAEALGAAAKHGIVHRDIKPENILISRAGEIKLSDLGVAKMSSKEDPSITGAEDMVGTPYYVAPEQARGKRDQMDTRTDIYSLGATLFHLATGQTPYEGETCTDIMMKHIEEKVPLAHHVNPNISEALGRVIAKMMQKKPILRHQTPAEVREALDRARLGVVVGRGETTRAVGVVGRRKSGRRSGPQAAVGANRTTGIRAVVGPKRTTGTRAAVRQSSVRIEPARQRSSRRDLYPAGLPSKHYLHYGLIAILLSIAALVGFLCVQAARPSDTAAVDSSPPDLAQMPPALLPANGSRAGAKPTLPPDVRKEPAGTSTGKKIARETSSAVVPGNNASVAPTQGKPVPGLNGWCASDVGDVAVPGQVTVAGGTLTLKASGFDIWGDVDEGFFIYRCLRGDGSLTARVKSIEEIDPWSKVGVMFRESLADDARYTCTFCAVNTKSTMLRRMAKRRPTRSTRGPMLPLPTWIRLTRKGNTFTGYVSSDGKQWERIASVKLPMGRDVYACLAATSHLDGSVSTMVLDQLSLEGTPTPPAEWPSAKNR